MSWVRNGKFFAIRPGEKIDVPQAKRYIGVDGDEEFFNQYFNQIVEEAQRVDYILGSAADLTLGAANVKWNGSVFKDEDDVTVTFASGDRIAIVSFDGGSVTFTTDNLHFDMEPDTEIDLTGILFTLSSDGCRGRLNFINAGASSILLTGSQSILDIRHDGGETAVSTNGQDVIINGTTVKSIEYDNIFMNSAALIAQRGTSFPSIANSVYGPDGFIHNKSGAMVGTFQQTADGPTVAESGAKVVNCVDLTTTTIDASIAAGDYCAISQPIEGSNILDIAGGFAVIGFWVSSPVTGTHCVAFRNQGSGAGTFASPYVPDRSYIKEYTIDTINTWEFKTFTIPIDDSSGTWDYSNGMGLCVTWTLAAGTTYQTTAETWATGNFLATANQVNVVGIVGAFKIAIPNMIKGQNYNNWVSKDESGLFRLYEKSYDINTVPGTITNNGAARTSAGLIAGVLLTTWINIVKKRTSLHDFHTYSNATGAIDTIRKVGVADNAVTYLYQGDAVVSIQATVAQSEWEYQWTSDASIYI